MRKNDKILTNLIKTWNIKDVYDWMSGFEQNLSKYAEIFAQNGVDGIALLSGQVDKNYLKTIIGIKEANTVDQYLTIIYQLGCLLYDNKNLTLQRLFSNATTLAKNIKSASLPIIAYSNSNKHSSSLQLEAQHLIINDKIQDVIDQKIIIVYQLLKILNKKFNDIVHWLSKMDFGIYTPGADDLQTIKITTCFLCVDLINITGKIFKTYLKVIRETSSPKSPDGKFILDDFIMDDNINKLTPLKRDISLTDKSRNRDKNSNRRMSSDGRNDVDLTIFNDLTNTMEVVAKFSTVVVRSVFRFDPCIFLNAPYYRKVTLKNTRRTSKSVEDLLDASQKKSDNDFLESNAPNNSTISDKTVHSKVSIVSNIVDRPENIIKPAIPTNIWGITVELVNEWHTISNITPSSPASECHRLEKGDQILAIGKRIIIGWELTNVLKLLAESRDLGLTLITRTTNTDSTYGATNHSNGLARLNSNHFTGDPSVARNRKSCTASLRMPAEAEQPASNNRNTQTLAQKPVHIKTHEIHDSFPTTLDVIKNTTSESTLSPDSAEPSAHLHMLAGGRVGRLSECERKDSSISKQDSGYIPSGCSSDRFDSFGQGHTTNQQQLHHLNAASSHVMGASNKPSSNFKFKFSPAAHNFIYAPEHPATTPEAKRTLNVVESILNQQNLGLVPPPLTTSTPRKNLINEKRMIYSSSFSSSDNDDHGKTKNRALDNLQSLAGDQANLKIKLADQKLAEIKGLKEFHQKLNKDLPKKPLPVRKISPKKLSIFSMQELGTLGFPVITDKKKNQKLHPKNHSTDLSGLHKSASSSNFIKTLGKKINKPFKKISLLAISSAINSPNTSGKNLQIKINGIDQHIIEAGPKSAPIVDILDDNKLKSTVTSGGRHTPSVRFAKHSQPLPLAHQQPKLATNGTLPNGLSYNNKKRRQTAVPNFNDYYLPYKHFESVNLTPAELRVIHDRLGLLQQHKEELSLPKPRERSLSEALDLADTLSNPNLEKKRNSLEKAIQEQNKEFAQVQNWILIKKISTTSPNPTGDDYPLSPSGPYNAPPNHVTFENNNTTALLPSPSPTAATFKAISSTIMSWFPTSLKSGWYQTRALLYYNDEDSAKNSSAPSKRKLSITLTSLSSSGSIRSTAHKERHKVSLGTSLVDNGANNDQRRSSHVENVLKKPAPYLYLQTPSWNRMANEMKFDIESLYLPDYMVKPSIRMHNCIKLIGNSQMIYMALSSNSEFKKWLVKLKAISKGYYQISTADPIHRKESFSPYASPPFSFLTPSDTPNGQPLEGGNVPVSIY